MRQLKKPHLVDKNVLLQYLIGNDPQKAVTLMESAEEGSEALEIPSLFVAEVIWTLEKFHQVPRSEIPKKLLIIFSFKGKK